MQLTDLWPVLLVTAPPPLLACLWGWRFRRWSGARVVLFAAAPIPLMLWAVGLWTVARNIGASEEECGFDACAMDTMGAISIAGIGFVVLAAGLVSAGLTDLSLRRWLGRSQADTDVYE